MKLSPSPAIYATLVVAVGLILAGIAGHSHEEPVRSERLASAQLRADSQQRPADRVARSPGAWAASGWSVSGAVKFPRGQRATVGRVCAFRGASASSELSYTCTPTDETGQFVLSTSFSPRLIVASAPRFLSAQLVLGGTEGRSVTNVTLQLLAPGAGEGSHVAGMVMDGTGGPVAGALVVGKDPAGGPPTGSAVSDEEGRFDFGVSAGSIALTATAEGYSSSTRHLLAPAEGVEFLLVPAAVITGRVVAQTNAEPIAGATVEVLGATTPGWSSAGVSSGEDGRFRIVDLPAGNYTLSANADGWQAGSVQVNVGLADQVEGVELALAEGASFSAEISVEGEPCAEASVVLAGVVRWGGVADEAGKLETSSLPPGEYEATISCGRAAPHREGLRVARGARTHRRWELELGATVRGRVERASGAPFAGARVSVTPATSVPTTPITGEGSRSGKTCESRSGGEFTCEGLEPGTYLVGLVAPSGRPEQEQRVTIAANDEADVVVRAPALAAIHVSSEGLQRLRGVAVMAAPIDGALPYVATPESGGYRFSSLPLGRYLVHLASARGDGVNVSLERDEQSVEVTLPAAALRRISGRVIDDAGNPLADTWVSARSADDFAGGSASVGALSDGQGNFSLEGLFDGQYEITATSPHGEATLESIRGGSVDVVVRVAAFGSLSGTVRTRSGATVPTFQVSYTHESGAGGVLLGSNGRWVLEWAAPGRYTIEIGSEEGTAEGTAILSGQAGPSELPLVVDDRS